AIGTYRHAISQTLPALTRAAWRDKHDEIERLMPNIPEDRFVFALSKQDYEREFGAEYKKPNWFDRLLAFLFRLMPKIGPVKPLKVGAPTPGAERLFLASLTETRNQFRQSLEALRGGHLSLRNIDFDTGRPSAHGEYDLADQTYAKLLDTLADRRFERVSAPL